MNKLNIIRTVVAKEVMEGAGVKVWRSIGGVVSVHDPFLLLDEANIPKSGAGFPEHPHRGFETVSYLLKGQSRHRDNHGGHGELSDGDVQWMTAGRGISHEETPIGNGPLHAFQIWVNLRAKDKMIDPYYQDLRAKDIPKKQIDDHSHVAVLAGSSISHGLKSPLTLRTPILASHVKISKNGHKFVETIPKGFQGLIYLFEGSGHINNGDDVVDAPKKSAVLFGETTQDTILEFESTSDSVEFLILAGVPHKEPVARHGPFVMNTKEEIMQAFEDYHSGKF